MQPCYRSPAKAAEWVEVVVGLTYLNSSRRFVTKAECLVKHKLEIRSFRYGGYWFGLAEPWPEGWYYTDNVYLDYADGGYYLYNPYYPGVRLEIIVVL